MKKTKEILNKILKELKNEETFYLQLLTKQGNPCIILK